MERMFSMLNKLWGIMILVGILVAACNGRIGSVGTAAIDSSKDAVMLCITMLGILSFWMGLMRIAERGGVIAGLSKKLKPVLRFLFPQIPPGHVANEQIAANMIANIFGLGWAATPAGLKAMERLEALEESRRKEMGTENGAAKRKKGHQTKPAPVPRGTANAEMCTFLIMNISSLQLIPVNIIAFRSQYGSVNPAEIIGPAILATVISTITAVIFCKFAQIFKFILYKSLIQSLAS